MQQYNKFNKVAALSNLSRYFTWKESHTKPKIWNIWELMFKLLSNERFELNNELDSVSDIQEYIIKKPVTEKNKNIFK